jgi:predicted XRE-type DNA-binding protein
MKSAVKHVRNERGEILYTIGSGNVFADLGLPNAEQLLAKSELTFQISRIIEERGLTQAEAASILGIDQPKVSALVRGKLSSVSMERLYRYLNALGRDIDIVVRPKAPGRSKGIVRVVMQKRRVVSAAKTSHHGEKSQTTTRRTGTKRLKRKGTRG